MIEIVPSTEKALKVFTGVFGFAMCLFAAWMSLEQNIDQIVMEIVTEQNRPIPKWWMSVFITYGFVGAAFYFSARPVPRGRGETDVVDYAPRP